MKINLLNMNNYCKINFLRFFIISNSLLFIFSLVFFIGCGKRPLYLTYPENSQVRNAPKSDLAGLYLNVEFKNLSKEKIQTSGYMLSPEVYIKGVNDDTGALGTGLSYPLHGYPVYFEPGKYTLQIYYMIPWERKEENIFGIDSIETTNRYYTEDYTYIDFIAERNTEYNLNIYVDYLGLRKVNRNCDITKRASKAK